MILGFGPGLGLQATLGVCRMKNEGCFGLSCEAQGLALGLCSQRPWPALLPKALTWPWPWPCSAWPCSLGLATQGLGLLCLALALYFVTSLTSLIYDLREWETIMLVVDSCPLCTNKIQSWPELVVMCVLCRLTKTWTRHTNVMQCLTKSFIFAKI